MLQRVKDNQLHLQCDACKSYRVEDIKTENHISEFDNYATDKCPCGSQEVFFLTLPQIDEDVKLPTTETIQRNCITQLNEILKEGN